MSLGTPSVGAMPGSVEAAMRELPRDSNYWTVGSAWIAEQRAARRTPGMGLGPEG